MQRLNRHSDDGAVAILVALLAVVLFGMGALAIDVGAMYAERRQLQNGADAAALAIAMEASKGRPCTDVLNTATAAQYANDNANDANTAVDSIACGSAQVTVVTSTTNSDGTTVLPPVFARVLPGFADYDGKTVHAQATARWGGLSSLTTLPLTFSMCEFDEFTDPDGDGVRVFTPGPPYVGDTITILFQGGVGREGPDDCEAVAGQDTDGDERLPGGFGWLEGAACQADIDAGMWVDKKPGASGDNSCDLASLVGTVLLLPIFDDVDTAANPDRYHIAGFAAFHLVGFRLPPERNSPPSCPANQGKCMRGHFVAYVTAAGSGGGPNLGATTAWLSD